MCTTDPANIYGAGAPLDIELLEGASPGCRAFPEISWCLCAGRPILIIESHGKRLTGLPWASTADIDSALIFSHELNGTDAADLEDRNV